MAKSRANQPDAPRRAVAEPAETGGARSPSRERLRSTEERLLAAADAAQVAEKAAASSGPKRGAAAVRSEAPKGTRRAVEIDEEGLVIGRVVRKATPRVRPTDDKPAAARAPRAAKAGEARKVAKAPRATKVVTAEASPGVVREVRGWGESGPAPRKPAAPRKSTVPRRTGPERLAPAKVRLQKVLASAGVAARRKAEDLITRRRVTVNGKIASELGVKVDPDRDEIKVDGKIVQIEKKVYFVLNKPDGVVCSAEGLKDAEGRPTVLSLLQVVTQRIYPVGRLDFHSRGVLILTNDGDLAAALTHPRHEVTKTYHVKFQGRLDEAALAALGQGIVLEDGTVTRPAEEVSVIKETTTNTWAQITLRQGLNRQIRRMGDALGHPVLKLIRVSVGQVTADGLADGEFRPLTPTEVYDLMAAALK